MWLVIIVIGTDGFVNLAMSVVAAILVAVAAASAARPKFMEA